MYVDLVMLISQVNVRELWPVLFLDDSILGNNGPNLILAYSCTILFMNIHWRERRGYKAYFVTKIVPQNSGFNCQQAIFVSKFA